MRDNDQVHFPNLSPEMRSIYFIALLFISSLSCTKDSVPFIPAPIGFTEIAKGYIAGKQNIPESCTLINNAVEWKDLITQMDLSMNVLAEINEQDIDFENYSVVALFLEVKGSIWEVQIDEMMEFEHEIQLSTSEIQSFLSAISQPYHIVKIPKTEKNLVLNWDWLI